MFTLLLPVGTPLPAHRHHILRGDGKLPSLCLEIYQRFITEQPEKLSKVSKHQTSASCLPLSVLQQLLRLKSQQRRRPRRGLVLLSALMLKCLLEQIPRVVTYLDKTRCTMGRRVHDLANVLLGNLGSMWTLLWHTVPQHSLRPHAPFQGNVSSEVFLSFRL